jgi:hypothetical protein
VAGRSVVGAVIWAGVVGLLAACGGGAKVATNHSANASTTAAGAAGAAADTPGSSLPTCRDGTGAAPSATSPAPTTGPNQSPPSGRTSAGAASVPTGTPASSGPAPAAGNYKYESTDSKGVVTQLSLAVKTNSTSGSVRQQTLTISSPQGSESNRYTWNPATGVSVSSTTLSGGSGSVQCNWTPDISQYVFSIHQGSSWSSLSHCSTTIAGTPATATYDDQATVSGYQPIQVAGQTLNTWVIHRKAVLTAKSATFDLTINTLSTEYFDPANGETPRELTDTTTSGSYAGKSFRQEVKATIEAETLSPQPS